MPKLTPQMFAFLQEPQVEAVLLRLYTQALKQNRQMFFHFLPKIFKLLGKGLDWTGENESFYEDKYIPIAPQQGKFLYMQALASGAKNIVEFGTSYGISTLYLAAAAKRNGGRVITCEYLPHKATAARKHFQEADLADYIELREGDALETLKDLAIRPDFRLTRRLAGFGIPRIQAAGTESCRPRGHHRGRCGRLFTRHAGLSRLRPPS